MITLMRELPQALYRAHDVRELDRLVIAQGISGYELMTRAGAAVLRVVRERWPRAHRLLIVCGTGNNGGDGFVVARLAHEAGLAVTVIAQDTLAHLRGDALSACEALHAAGLEIQAFSSANWPMADVIVDALFGTGLDRDITGATRNAVECMNAANVPMIAVDIPSGLHADTGRVLGMAARAHTTVTFIALKQGLFTGDGPAYCGDIVFDDLDVPAATHASMAPSALRVLDTELTHALPPRPRNAHKGNYGHVLVIGGDCGMAGAVRLTAQAALRVGAALVSLATHPEHAAVATALVPEIMSHAVHDAQALRPLFARANVIAIGPGLGQGQWGKVLLDAALDSGLPLVVDADALNLLARDPIPRAHWVLTPHPGEAARLLGCAAAEVQADRFAALRALRARYGGVVVLKGVGSLIAGDGELVRLCGAGNPGMASGGMGDVLTGVIAGLAAQGLPLTQAAALGVHLHARAGDDAARDGERGLVASDLMPALRRWANPPPCNA